MLVITFLVVGFFAVARGANGSPEALKQHHPWHTKHTVKTKGQLLEEVGLAATGVGSFLQNGKGELFKDCYINVDWDKEEIKRVLCASGAEAKVMPAVKQ